MNKYELTKTDKKEIKQLAKALNMLLKKTPIQLISFTQTHDENNKSGNAIFNVKRQGAKLVTIKFNNSKKSKK